jgi:nucleoside-diphosphate-sugar epimerase
MNVLLTGHSGFLGNVLLTYLNVNCVVSTISRKSGDYNIDLSITIPRFKEEFDLVIHAAGLTPEKASYKQNKAPLLEENVLSTNNLLSGLELSKIPKMFCFISSVAVYGAVEGVLINEDSELKASSTYGISKIQSEQLVLNWCAKNNVTCTILRLPLVVSSNPYGNLWSMISGIKKGFYFNIAGGSAKKSMVLASDVAKYLLKASEIGGIFNLTDGYHPSFFEFSDNISRQLGKSRSINLPFWLAKGLALTGDLFGAKAPFNSAKLYKMTSDLTFDDSKAREAFGWKPTPVLEGFKISDKN